MKEMERPEKVLDKTTEKKAKMVSTWLGKKKKKILILGCGPCFEGKILRDAGHYIVGVDINPEILKIARKNCHEVYQCDVTEKLPFSNNSFDVIVAFELIEHLGFVNRFLKECYRTLRKMGLLILSTPSESYWKNRLSLLAGKEILSDSHPRLFTPKSLKKKLEKHNFVIEKMKGIGTLGFLLSTKFPVLSLCGDFIVKAKKK